MEQTQETPSKLSPKFFFFSLGVLVTLITSVSSFLVLLFQTLNQQFPDALNATYQYGYQSYNYDGIRAAIATLIIVFPVFLVLSYFWNKSYKNGLGSIDAVIRKWMIYVILFLASVIVIVDLVTLVRYFVSGEITIRFILKVIGTLIVAGLGGSYYILELGPKEKLSKHVSKIYGAVSVLIMLALIIFSFAVIGSPAKQRMWRLDDRRIQDLSSIQSQVIGYWQQKSKLPETLNDLANPLSYYNLPVDPEVDAKGYMYEYKKTGTLSFEICGTFSLPMPKGWQEYQNGGGIIPMPATSEVGVSYPYPGRSVNDSWDHQAGRTCFERTIDKDIYPPYPKQ